jgi:hypothetical protein
LLENGFRLILRIEAVAGKYDDVWFLFHITIL